MNKDWKYRIGKNNAGTVMGILMLLLFGGVTLWLYLSNNGAFLFGLILTLVMLAIDLAAVYNALFHRVLIGDKSLYYQTSPQNKKEYKYTEIAKVWVSSGKNLNGTESDYCNVRLCSGEDIKFSFFPNETEGIEYLIERVERCGNTDKIPSASDDNVYKIDGRFLGKTRIVISVVILVMTVVLEIALYKNPFMRYMIAVGIVAVLSAFIYNLVRYFCFSVKIEVEGFYVRTNPFDGKYYNYSVIKKCKAVMKEYTHRRKGHGTERMYCYYFVFTDRDGITRKFQFEKAVNGYEIEILKDRILRANN